MRGILAQLRANRDWLAATLAAALPGVTMRVTEATYQAARLPGAGIAMPGRAVLSGSGQGRAEFWRDLWCGLRGVRAA
jgi:hypothetical protein